MPDSKYIKSKIIYPHLGIIDEVEEKITEYNGEKEKNHGKN